MAGTLFGLPLSQQLDENGNPQSGALLYIYAALTSTPADSFADSGLATLNSFPLVADASGRIPQFWLNDGSYRARLTTAAGVEIFDEDSILALGPSVASSGGSGGGSSGGGGGTTVDATTVFTTGDMKWRPVTGALTGWVRCNGRTIGSAGSGATERASADTETLYGFLWNNFNNTLCPVATGRGAGPTADFAANKAIGMLDMRGYGIYGLDDMGAAAAGRLVTGSPTSAASSTGAEKTTLAIANLPAHDHAAGTFVAAAHTHTAGSYSVSGAQEGTNVAPTGGSGKQYATNQTLNVSGTSGSTSPAVTGTSASTGSGTAATTISPGRLGTWYMHL